MNYTVGDRVKFVGNEEVGLKVGDLGTIRNIDDMGMGFPWPYEVHLDRDDLADTVLLSASEIEPA